MSWDWTTVYAWVNTPMITIGKTPITLASVVGLVVIVIFVWWFSSVVERTLRRVALYGRHPSTSSTVYAFSRLVRYVVWIVGTLIGLSYLGFDLTSLALLGGAIGVGIGFGLQNIFSSFISGIIILVEKTLKVGDFVDLQSGVRGTVTEIAMRYTRITTNDDVDILVPNQEFINGRVMNWTFGDRTRRIRVPFGVAYGSDKNAVREAGIAAARTVRGIIEDEQHPIDVRLVAFGESSLDFQLLAWVGPDILPRPGGTRGKLLWALETELTARGIEIPFPQRDLHLRSGSLPIRMDKDGSDTEEDAPLARAHSAKGEPPQSAIGAT
ncbi:MAG: mechanosensitive ion channel family protein [Burkholderiales bacterium]